MKAPSYEQPPLDPEFKKLSDQAQTDKFNTLQQMLGSDTARILRQYGARTALSGASVGIPLATPALMTGAGGQTGLFGYRATGNG